MVGGAIPSTWNFGSTGLCWSEIADFQSIFARSASIVTPSEKKVRLTLIGIRQRAFQWAWWSSYVARKPPKVAQKHTDLQTATCSTDAFKRCLKTWLFKRAYNWYTDWYTFYYQHICYAPSVITCILWGSTQMTVYINIKVKSSSWYSDIFSPKPVHSTAGERNSGSEPWRACDVSALEETTDWWTAMGKMPVDLARRVAYCWYWRHAAIRLRSYVRRERSCDLWNAPRRCRHPVFVVVVVVGPIVSASHRGGWMTVDRAATAVALDGVSFRRGITTVVGRVCTMTFWYFWDNRKWDSVRQAESAITDTTIINRRKTHLFNKAYGRELVTAYSVRTRVL